MSQPRVRLMMGPGTLPSQGRDRLDLARYRSSGRPQLTGHQLLGAVPEIAAFASVTVDEANPPGGTFDYQGKTYYFCSTRCRDSFHQNPAATIKMK